MSHPVSNSTPVLDQFIRLLRMSNPDVDVTISICPYKPTYRTVSLKAKKLQLAFLLLAKPYGMYVHQISPKFLDDSMSATIQVQLF